MRHEAEVKKLLVSNAIHLIAEGGFEKATTKELTHCGGSLPDFKMNEVYIYRIFGSKECLYEAAFLQLDEELFGVFREIMESVPHVECNTREWMCEFFNRSWRFALGNEERCRCYVRYYYSIYFKGESLELHTRLFEERIASFKPLFKEEADVTAILHSVFILFFDFVIRVYNGMLEDNEDNRKHIFRVLYLMMEAYFKNPV